MPGSFRAPEPQGLPALQGLSDEKGPEPHLGFRLGPVVKRQRPADNQGLLDSL